MMKYFAWNLFYNVTGKYCPHAGKDVSGRSGIHLHLSSATCQGCCLSPGGNGRRRKVTKDQRGEVPRIFPKRSLGFGLLLLFWALGGFLHYYELRFIKLFGLTGRFVYKQFLILKTM